MGFWQRIGRRRGSLPASDPARAAALLARSIGPNPLPPPTAGTGKSVADHLVEAKLLDRGYACAAQFEARARGVPVATVLAEQGSVPRDRIIRAIESCDTALLAMELDYDVRLPRQVLRDFKVVVHAQTDEAVMVSALANWGQVVQALSPFTGKRRLVAVPWIAEKWAEFEQNIDRIIEPFEDLPVANSVSAPRSVLAPHLSDVEKLDALLDRAARDSVSDIHIEPSKSAYAVFFRELGVRKQVHAGTLDEYARLCAMIKDRARLDTMETRLPQDGSFSVKLRGRGFDIRVASLPVDGREKLVLRMLDPVRAQMKLSELGITEVEVWRRIVAHRNGVVLIVGSTGSGKTTTLNATVREMDRIGRAIYTIEDPVEYRIPSVTHLQVNDMVGFTYARGARALMRADPEVVVLGEIRDVETAAYALQLAQTGHLVMATIHAESVPMALTRLLDLKVARTDLELLLRGVLVQFMLRSLCVVCNGAGSGCATCNETGYGGRTVVSEMAQVREGDVQRILARETYWVPLWKDLERKLLAGVVDGREIYRCFASELDVYAQHSEALQQVMVEEEERQAALRLEREVAMLGARSETERLAAGRQKLVEQAAAADIELAASVVAGSAGRFAPDGATGAAEAAG